MNKKIVAIVSGLLLFSICFIGNAVVANNTDNNGYDDPSPNSGDGISDGSGYDQQNGPYGDGSTGSGYHDPAPNSGDGIPDGSGWN